MSCLNPGKNLAVVLDQMWKTLFQCVMDGGKKTSQVG